MTTQAIAYRRLDRPHNQRKVIRLVAEGKTDQQIADQLGYDQSSVYRFRQRHAAEIEAMQERMLAETVDFAVASKVQRVADLDDLRTKLQAEIEQNGAAYIEETRHGRKRHLNPALPELRATLQQAALEMDQLPRAGVTVNNQNVVIVRQVSGPADTSGNPEL